MRTGEYVLNVMLRVSGDAGLDAGSWLYNYRGARWKTSRVYLYDQGLYNTTGGVDMENKSCL